MNICIIKRVKFENDKYILIIIRSFRKEIFKECICDLLNFIKNNLYKYSNIIDFLNELVKSVSYVCDEYYNLYIVSFETLIEFCDDICSEILLINEAVSRFC